MTYRNITIVDPVMYTNFGPVTVIENDREYHCELVSLFSGRLEDYAELRHPEKSFFCKVEYFHDHQVLHELKPEEIEACAKAYADMWDVM